MSNANRDYAIVYDVKNSSLVLNRPLIFYITDINTSNIFVRLVTKVNIGNGVDQYTDIEEASSYALTMRVIKPNNEVKSIEATQHEPESIFQFDLTEDFKDIPGKYICELTISTIVSERQELITSDPFNYEVKRSILSNVSEVIETEDTTVEKLLNNLEASKIRLFNDLELAKTNLHNDLNATSSTLNSQVQANDNKIENIKKELSSRLDVTGAELSSQIKDIVYLSSNFKKIQGENDDTERLQRAIDFTSSIGATLQIVEPLLIRDTIILRDNTSLFSNNSSAKIYTDIGESRNGLVMLQGVGVQNIKIVGLTIEGMGYGETAPLPQGNLNGTGSGILLANCENILIEGCTVFKCGGYKGNEGVGNIWLSCCRKAKIINNTVFLGGNLICVDRWYAFNEGYENIFNQDIVISNNNLYWCSGRGIALECINDKGNIVISNNTFTGIGYSAIEGRDWINTSITGNVVYGNKDLKINAKDYLNSDDDDWEWNTWDNSQFGIEVINTIKDSVIVGNIIKDIKHHGMKLNNLQNVVVSSNSLSLCEDVGIYIKNVTFNSNTLNINDNILNVCNKGIYIAKDDNSDIFYDGVVIEGNSIKAKEGITIIDLYMGIIANNNLTPITNYGGSSGIKISKSAYSILSGNLYKMFTNGIIFGNDEHSTINDKFINCNASITINKGKNLVLDCYISGGTTAIDNKATSYCDATKSVFVNVATLKTGHGVKLKIERAFTSSTGNQPSNGVWSIGDIILNSTPSLNNTVGIICVGNGNVGLWKNISIISEN